jgi:hypothetical protein
MTRRKLQGNGKRLIGPNDLVEKSEGVYVYTRGAVTPRAYLRLTVPERIELHQKLHQTTRKPHKIRGGQSNNWLL